MMNRWKTKVVVLTSVLALAGFHGSRGSADAQAVRAILTQTDEYEINVKVGEDYSVYRPIRRLPSGAAVVVPDTGSVGLICSNDFWVELSHETHSGEWLLSAANCSLGEHRDGLYEAYDRGDASGLNTDGFEELCSVDPQFVLRRVHAGDARTVAQARAAYLLACAHHAAGHRETACRYLRIFRDNPLARFSPWLEKAEVLERSVACGARR